MMAKASTEKDCRALLRQRLHEAIAHLDELEAHHEFRKLKSLAQQAARRSNRRHRGVRT